VATDLNRDLLTKTDVSSDVATSYFQNSKNHHAKPKVGATSHFEVVLGRYIHTAIGMASIAQPALSAAFQQAAKLGTVRRNIRTHCSAGERSSYLWRFLAF
jgi:hypothetical protein